MLKAVIWIWVLALIVWALWLWIGPGTILLLAYFLPTLIAIGHRNQAAIFVLNLFLGWTFIGWVIALVWAFTADREMAMR